MQVAEAHELKNEGLNQLGKKAVNQQRAIPYPLQASVVVTTVSSLAKAIMKALIFFLLKAGEPSMRGERTFRG